MPPSGVALATCPDSAHRTAAGAIHHGQGERRTNHPKMSLLPIVTRATLGAEGLVGAEQHTPGPV
ncbi:hypothetical protein GCM10010335_56700 [Streptomyces galbus]|nr:hypothetical protein GCM10010335_56700 [Streptomyces galbus]